MSGFFKNVINYLNRYLKVIIGLVNTGALQLASPPGRGRLRAAPSPTPTSNAHSTRHLSTSDEDNNAHEEKEEVCIFLFVRKLNFNQGDDFISMRFTFKLFKIG